LMVLGLWTTAPFSWRHSSHFRKPQNHASWYFCLSAWDSRLIESVLRRRHSTIHQECFRRI
jgi:hypothetical protein